MPRQGTMQAPGVAFLCGSLVYVNVARQALGLLGLEDAVAWEIPGYTQYVSFFWKKITTY